MKNSEKKLLLTKGLYRGAIQEALIEAIILGTNLIRNEKKKLKIVLIQKEINKP